MRFYRWVVFCDTGKTQKRIKQLGIRLSDLINTDWCHKVQSAIIMQGHVRCTCLCELKKKR